ncbi:MAG: hypothetical protein ACOCWR_05065 [Oceanidesulfovibrio sp.]
MTDRLRKKALDILTQHEPEDRAHEEDKALYEMRVHQIELELQNEELATR